MKVLHNLQLQLKLLTGLITKWTAAGDQLSPWVWGEGLLFYILSSLYLSPPLPLSRHHLYLSLFAFSTLSSPLYLRFLPLSLPLSI